MFKNYLKSAWRNLWKRKAFSIINVSGLAIGMAAFIIIMMFVSYEKSFDDFQPKNIYRLNEVQKFEGMISSQKVALSMFPMGPTLKNEFPEIKNFTRVSWSRKMQIRNNDKRLYLDQGLMVDSTFLQIFNFKMLKGNPQTALEKPNSAVITKATAEKLFGNTDAVGKTITFYGGDTTAFLITAVLDNVPQNSQIQFDALFSFSTAYSKNPRMMDNWGGNWLDTYLVLAPNTNVDALQRKFPAYLKKYMASSDNWKNYELFLLPLQDVHSKAADIGLDYLNYQKFDNTYTNIFFIIALVVLVIACINFMNLSTARSAERAREVGIRKSVGAFRWQLGLQFISESVILSMVAMIIALGLVELCLPYVNHLSQRKLAFPIFEHPSLLAGILAGTLAIGLLSGLYPAFYLSAFKPVKVLKGSIQTGRNKSLLRNSLVVVQFASAIFLIISTVFAVRQLKYMQHQDPGFSMNQVVTVPLDRLSYKNYNSIKQDLLASSYITGVTAAQDELGSHLDQSGIQFQGDGPLRQLTGTRLIVDPDYLTVYKIPLVAGRNFSKEKSANGKEYIINETMAKELLKDSKGKNMQWLLGRNFGFDSSGIIVGIAKDFNFNSLHYKIESMFLFNLQDRGFSNLSVKINGQKAREAIAFLHSVWQKDSPESPFEYHFLDDHFADVYRADTQVSTIVGILAALAIVISCLGLFGLASYAAERRVKEVGIRKVMGASVNNIVLMLSKDFLKYVLIAALIAWPLAWFSVYKWLQDYAYRIQISWWIFLVAVAIAMIIAFATISFQSIKAALANPVKSLRSE